MGQCMEESLGSSKHHPLLGRIQQEVQKGKCYFKTTIAISDEETYIEWSKKVNKLRYQPELKDNIYLPCKEDYKKPGNKCQAVSFLELFLEPYQQTLKESLSCNMFKKRWPTQCLVWNLMMTLLKYVRFCQGKGESISHVNLDTILLMPDGKVRVIPKNILKGSGLTPLNEYEIQEQMEEVTTPCEPDGVTSPINIIGIISLCYAELIDPQPYYNQSTQTWRHLPQSQIDRALKKCQERYCTQLVNVMRGMLKNDPFCPIKVKSSNLLERLSELENEVQPGKCNESLVDINMSIMGFKSAQLLESKVMNRQDGNLLMISGINCEDWQKSKKSVRDEVEEESKRNTLDIL